MSNTLHIITAAQQVHEAAKYYPITDNDKKSLLEAGIFAGAVAGVMALFGMLRGGNRRPATGR